MLRPVLCLSLLLLTACGRIPGAIESKAQASNSGAPERSLASYLHDLSPVIDGVTVENAVVEHYEIPTSDGITLDSWIRRPATEGPQPLVLYVTPYYGGGDPTMAANALGDPSLVLAPFLIPRGYAVGFLSVRGTGNSGGCYTSGGVAERRELGEAIEYLAAQPWSNGKVGTIGVSFDGATSAELFTEAPPSLKAVVPIEAVTDYYRYGFNNGVLRNINGAYPTYYVPVSDTAPAGLEGGVGPSDPVGFARAVSGNVCADQVTTQAASVENVATQNKTPYWQERDLPAIVRSSLEKPRPAMFYIQGHQDANVDTLHATDWLEAAYQTGAPIHIWMGQWVHEYQQSTDGSPCQEFAPCRGDFWEVALLAWFDQFLKGIDTGILDAPAVQTQADDGVWRHEDHWPPKTLEDTALYPSSDGSLAIAAGSGTVSYKDNTVTVPTQGPVYQTQVPAPLNGSTLEFVSAPLEHDLRLTGAPRLQSVVTADGARANLIATLLARTPDGSQRYINFAAQSLNHIASLEQGDLDITGKALALDVGFFPLDSIVYAGEQLVLVLSGTIEQRHSSAGGNSANLQNSGARLLPIGMGANISLDLAQTRLVLPRNPGDRVEPLDWLEE